MTHVTCRLTEKEPGLAPEPYTWQSSMGYLFAVFDKISSDIACSHGPSVVTELFFL